MTLNTDALSFSYKDKPVIEGITFRVEPGEVLGILGPNGCGKTTLLKNLNRNLRPSSGSVMIDDIDLESINKKAIARIVASIPQTNEIRFSFTVREIVGMGRMPFLSDFSGETSEDERIIDDALAKVNITDMADRYISTMSGGERQRVIIARALAQTPKVLLMDEPTLHLDINAQFDILELVRDLSHSENMAVVIVSHDLPMVARYCDNIIMIHNHKIHAAGRTEEVLTPENMRIVFGVDAELSVDSKTGNNTVILHGSAKCEL